MNQSSKRAKDSEDNDKPSSALEDRRAIHSTHVTGQQSLECRSKGPTRVQNDFPFKLLKRKRRDSGISNSGSSASDNNFSNELEDFGDSSSMSDEGYEGGKSVSNSSDRGSGSSSDDGNFNGDRKNVTPGCVTADGQWSDKASDQGVETDFEENVTSRDVSSCDSLPAASKAKPAERGEQSEATTTESASVMANMQNDSAVCADGSNNYLEKKPLRSVPTPATSSDVLSRKSPVGSEANKSAECFDETNICLGHSFNYIDRSKVKDEEPLVPITAPLRVPSFPAKMMAVLSRGDLSNVICWLPHGRSWHIVNPRGFELQVIAIYFEHSRFSSFIRQLKGWGFRRFSEGGQAQYCHEFFLRGLPHLIKKMQRIGDSKNFDVHPNHVPNFFSISENLPIPDAVHPDDLNYSVIEAINQSILNVGPSARLPLLHIRSRSNLTTLKEASPDPSFQSKFSFNGADDTNKTVAVSAKLTSDACSSELASMMSYTPSDQSFGVNKSSSKQLSSSPQPFLSKGNKVNASHEKNLTASSVIHAPFGQHFSQNLWQLQQLQFLKQQTHELEQLRKLRQHHATYESRDEVSHHREGRSCHPQNSDSLSIKHIMDTGNIQDTSCALNNSKHPNHNILQNYQTLDESKIQSSGIIVNSLLELLLKYCAPQQHSQQPPASQMPTSQQLELPFSENNNLLVALAMLQTTTAPSCQDEHHQTPPLHQMNQLLANLYEKSKPNVITSFDNSKQSDESPDPTSLLQNILRTYGSPPVDNSQSQLMPVPSMQSSQSYSSHQLQDALLQLREIFPLQGNTIPNEGVELVNQLCQMISQSSAVGAKPDGNSSRYQENEQTGNNFSSEQPNNQFFDFSKPSDKRPPTDQK